MHIDLNVNNTTVIHVIKITLYTDVFGSIALPMCLKFYFGRSKYKWCGDLNYIYPALFK